MKLSKIINQTNQIEISKFYNILTTIISEIDESIPLEKNTDAEHFVKTFNKPEVYERYKKELHRSIKNDIIIDIVSDIVLRDGNCIMSRDWFKELLDKEIKEIRKRMRDFEKIFKNGNKDIDEQRIRDYRIFHECTKTAYFNDLETNSSAKISLDELSILRTLKKGLGLSNDEFRSIYFFATETRDLEKYDIDQVIKKIKDAGIAFYRKRCLNLYIPDEIVFMLRDIKNIELPDKYTRRILKCLDNRMINRIKKIHGVTKTERHEKIEAIIKQGVDINSILSNEIFDSHVNENEKKKVINDIIESKLEIHLPHSGRTVKDKIENLVSYFINLEKDPNIGITKDGYESLLKDLLSFKKDIVNMILQEFELDPKIDLSAEVLLDYNIKPKDILYLNPLADLKQFCVEKQINYRGKNIINSILGSYRDSENIYIENFTLIANNDINGLKNNGVELKSEEIGSAFENVTKAVFRRLGLNVDDDLKKVINSKTNKTDIILNIGDKEIIIVECKSSKKEYSRFSTVTRQLNSYVRHCEKSGFNVKKSILIAGNFSEDFVKECDTFYDFPVTLIESQAFVNIYEEFKSSKLDSFPTTLFRHGLLKEDVVLKALNK